MGNTFTNNSDSGIKTELPELMVANNTATRNGEYGIYAPAAIDLGGNVAWGNDVAQCVGLTCTKK